MAISINRGMYFEKILKNTEKHYLNSGTIMLFKRELPLKITQFLPNRSVVGQIVENALVDYFGIYNGLHFEFEAKQTSSDKFVLTNLHYHQYQHLEAIWNAKGIAFLLVYFVKYQTCFLVEFDQIKTVWQKQKSLDISWFQQNAQVIEMVFPGYLDLLQYFESKQNL